MQCGILDWTLNQKGGICEETSKIKIKYVGW